MNELLSQWQDVAALAVVAAAAAYLLVRARRRARPGGAAPGCESCPVNRVKGVAEGRERG